MWLRKKNTTPALTFRLQRFAFSFVRVFLQFRAEQHRRAAQQCRAGEPGCAIAIAARTGGWQGDNRWFLRRRAAICRTGAVLAAAGPLATILVGFAAVVDLAAIRRATAIVAAASVLFAILVRFAVSGAGVAFDAVITRAANMSFAAIGEAGQIHIVAEFARFRALGIIGNHFAGALDTGSLAARFCSVNDAVSVIATFLADRRVPGKAAEQIIAIAERFARVVVTKLASAAVAVNTTLLAGAPAATLTGLAGIAAGAAILLVIAQRLANMRFIDCRAAGGA